MFVECRHIMPRGTKCKAPALNGHPYCYFHDKLHDYTQDGRSDHKGPLCLASIEDACGIQMALSQIMSAMASGRLDSRDGARLIYGIQVGIQVLDRVPATPPQEIVHATSCDGIGVDIANQDAGLGEPHPECSTCVNRFGCENVARQNKKSLRHLFDEARDRRERAEREPLALPAGSDDSSQCAHRREALETGPGEQLPTERVSAPVMEEQPVPRDHALAGAEEKQPAPQEPALVHEEQKSARELVPAPSSCSGWSPDPHRPVQEFVDPKKEAAREARVNKFRWQKPEPPLSLKERERLTRQIRLECDREE